jgi:Cu2+-exporting ATPase
VTAGTSNTSGALLVQVRSRVQDNSLSRIIRLVEAAQSSKAPIQRVADRIVPWFVLVTLICASATFFYWNGREFELALMAATSVLIITCPCALGMATPMSIAVASGLGAKHGILVRNGLVLETLSKATHFVFDKTGTLTEGRMSVAGHVCAEGVDPAETIRLAAAVERLSEHGLARAVTAYADERRESYRDLMVEGFQSTPGLGVEADVCGRRLLAGNANWLIQRGVTVDAALQAQAAAFEAEAMTCVYVALSGRHVGVFAVADRLRDGARQLIDELRESGVSVTLLSGDRRPVADAVARQLGAIDVIAEVLPQDKDRVIRQMQERGDVVVMVGDGINDAPALIRADIGIALGSGTDVSVDSADIVLMQNDLAKVIQALRLSRLALQTIRQNIGLSFAYNAIMVPLAMMAKVSPLVAAVTMPISSLVVIGNAARIRRLFK